jgi:hypothetical protein
MKTIEELFLLHTKLVDVAPCYGAVYQSMCYHQFGCGPGETLLEFRTKIATEDMPHDHPKRSAFLQGFYCLDIHLYAVVSEEKETVFKWHILNRLDGVGMAIESWCEKENSGLGIKHIASDEILDLVSRFFTKPPKVEEPVCSSWDDLFSSDEFLG